MCVLQACNNEIHSVFGITSKAVGVLFSMFYIGYIPSALITGSLSDKKGKIPFIVLGMVFIAISPIIFILSETYIHALLSVLLMGIGGGMVDTNSLGFIGDLFDGRKRTAMLGLTQVVFGIGALLSPFLVGLFLKLNGSYNYAYIFVGLSALIGLIFMIISQRMREEKPVSVSENKMPVRKIFTDTYVYFILLAILLYCGAEFGFGGWVSFYFGSILKQNPTMCANSVSVFWLGITVGSALFAVLLKKYTEYQILTFSLAGTVLGFAMFFSGRILPVLIGDLLIGCFLGPVFPAIVALGSERYRECSGTINSVILTFANIAGIIFPILIGTLTDHVGIKNSMFTVVVLCIVHLGILRFYAKKNQTSDF